MRFLLTYFSFQDFGLPNGHAGRAELSFAQSSLGSNYSLVSAITQPVTVVLCTTGWSAKTGG
jgi:hypothetical protein